MASRNLTDLSPDFRRAAEKIVAGCANHSVELLIYCTFRDCHEQSRIYRKTRTAKSIQRKISQLRKLGFVQIPAILEDVGPQPGTIGPPHLTYACPGESLHQWGRAFDAAPVRDGKISWDEFDIQWLIYGQMCKEAGMAWGGDFTSPDMPHCQAWCKDRLNPLADMLRSGLEPEKIEADLFSRGVS